MKILKIDKVEGIILLRVDTLEDLWTVERVLFENDYAKSKTLRKFKVNDTDEGELKEVIITVRVEKVLFDDTSKRLRISGKIVEGKPLEFIRLNSYHTINIAEGDILEIKKDKWPEYLIKILEEAEEKSRRPRLGIIVMDEEKALPTIILGYGIQFKNEIYSNTSKRQSKKEFAEEEEKYFQAIIKEINNMDVNIVVVAGPGFAKEDLKKYIDKQIPSKKPLKRIEYMQAGDAERSAVYALIKSEEIGKLLKNETIRKEFLLMSQFLEGLATKSSKYGIANVREAIENYSANTIIVNDSVLNSKEVQRLLGDAENRAIKIEVINSKDEAGMQLAAFKDIACF
ncbi:MAG: mRNA surveillance protein pelota [Candidatus Micrarchaeaceae archaeon]